MDVRELKTDIIDKCRIWGADLVGVADLAPLENFIAENYLANWQGYQQAISIAVFFPRPVVLELKQDPTHTYLTYYDALNRRIDDICLRLANYLSAVGYLAFPVPASQRVGPRKLASIFSHRLAARQAGLGWVGRHGSIINPEQGACLRLGTVLTNTDLPSGQPLAQSCPPNCQICQKACPAKAITGVAFTPENEAITKRIRAADCAAYLHKTRQTFGKEICGICLAVCPYSQGKHGIDPIGDA